jgi:hypothetical protein
MTTLFVAGIRHAREGGHPGGHAHRPLLWIPAFAGMTTLFVFIRVYQ